MAFIAPIFYLPFLPLTLDRLEFRPYAHTISPTAFLIDNDAQLLKIRESVVLNNYQEADGQLPGDKAGKIASR